MSDAERGWWMFPPEPYKAGIDARKAGLPPSANPYPRGLPNTPDELVRNLWEEGYREQQNRE